MMGDNVFIENVEFNEELYQKNVAERLCANALHDLLKRIKSIKGE